MANTADWSGGMSVCMGSAVLFGNEVKVTCCTT